MRCYREVIRLKGKTSGYLVVEHITVSKYSWPDRVLGKGPTQSIMTLLNGSSVTGIGIKGAGGMGWLGFPAI